jgi:hypothetical protein
MCVELLPEILLDDNQQEDTVTVEILCRTKARSVTKLFWYYFEVLFSGGSRPQYGLCDRKKKTA